MMTGNKKKNSLVSVLKRIFSLKKETDKKKGKKGLWGHGETRSLFPLFRQPSSIEKILGEADHLNIRPPFFLQSPKIVEKLPSQKSIPSNSNRYPEPFPPEAFPASSSNVGVPSEPAFHTREEEKRASSASDPGRCPEPRFLEAFPASSSNLGDPSSDAGSRVTEGSDPESYPEPCPAAALPASSDDRREDIKHSSALKIQAAYRRHLARRRSSRAPNGIERLQEVMRGQNVRRQTINAIKQMQLLVKVQTHIWSQRIQLLENQAHELHRMDKDFGSSSSKLTLNQILSEPVRNEDWDDSLLTKEEEEAQLKKKAEAIMKRGRAMSYAYSHQLWKSNPRSVHIPLDVRFDRFPWSWNWFHRPEPVSDVPRSQKTADSIVSTPLRPSSESKTNLLLHPRSYKHSSFDSKSQGSSATPRSAKSAAPFMPTTRRSLLRKASPAASSKDDESLVSCPPFTRPHYMTPTISAMAKVRANSNPKERFLSTPDSKRRFSLPFTPNNGNFKWNRRDSASSRTGSQRHESPRSVGSSAANTTVSMPAFGSRRKPPFNRFV